MAETLSPAKGGTLPKSNEAPHSSKTDKSGKLMQAYARMARHEAIGKLNLQTDDTKKG